MRPCVDANLCRDMALRLFPGLIQTGAYFQQIIPGFAFLRRLTQQEGGVQQGTGGNGMCGNGTEVGPLCGGIGGQGFRV